MTRSEKRIRAKARRLRREKKKRIAMAMAAIIVTLIIILVCIKFTATETVAENTSRFSKKYYKSYMIEAGDTLWTIAESECGPRWKNKWDYIDEVMRINGLHSEKIRAGKYLSLPYYT